MQNENVTIWNMNGHIRINESSITTIFKPNMTITIIPSSYSKEG